jgi:negative regulator of sigma E activity
MSDKLKIDISALMDGSKGDYDSVSANLDSVLKDIEHSKVWSRYHAVKDILTEEHASIDISGLEQRVSQAIAEEPTLLVPTNYSSEVESQVELPLTSNVIPFSAQKLFKVSAIAASVVAALLVGMNIPQDGISGQPNIADNTNSVEPTVTDDPIESLIPAPILVATEPQESLSRNSAMPPRLKRLVNHHQQRVWSGTNSAVPYATVVRY